MLIGMFDSGAGGLSVLCACKKAVPYARYLYLDDSAHCPYGNKPEEEIKRIALENARILFDAGCDAIVIACNTATAAAAPLIRKEYPDKVVIGIEPAVRPALGKVKGKILLLATPVTANLRSYPDRVIVGAEETLAAEIEAAYPNASALKALAKKTLAKYSGYEAVVTGCTHYAHLIPYIDAPVFDGAEGVARRLRSITDKFTGG